MNRENEIVQLLHEIKDTLGEHSQILAEHSQILGEHSQILGEHSQKLNGHDQKFAEQRLILDALMNGQESLKAEMSELKLQNAKEFGKIKEQVKDVVTSIEILKEENWNNKKDIRRIQKTMGMSN